MSTNTVRLHRVLRAPPERVYRAFLDADAMAKWLPPNGFTGKVHHLEPEVGGTLQDVVHELHHRAWPLLRRRVSGLVPNERIRHTDKFDDPNLPGQMHTTVSLKKVSCGTELNVVQEGIPAAIPVEACYLGWQESLALLAQARRGRDSGVTPTRETARSPAARDEASAQHAAGLRRPRPVFCVIGADMTTQGFVVSHAKDARSERGLRSFFTYRDLGIRDATAGRVAAHVIRAAAGGGF